MKIYNFLDEEPVIVKGKKGVDKVNAVVPENSFVVPKENVPVAVKLTEGELLVPPSQVDILRANAKKLGINMRDLAPKGRYTYPPGQDIHPDDHEGYTESQLRDRNTTVKAEEIPNTGIYTDFRKANESPLGHGYVGGGLVKRKTLNQQEATALGIDSNNINEMAKNTPQPQTEDDIVTQLGEVQPIDINEGIPEQKTNQQKIQELLSLSTPKFDEQKAERLKRIAAVNSIGQGFSAAVSGIAGARGGPILNTNTDITPKALAEYTAMIKEDKDNKYKTSLAKANAGIVALKEEQKIIAKNKAYNQQLKSEWNKLTAKITLEDIQERNKRALRLQDLATEYGFKINLENIRSENQLKAVKEAGKNAKAVAYIRASNNDNTKPTNPPVTFSLYGVDDEISENDVVAIANTMIAEKQAGLDSFGNPVKVEDLNEDPEYVYATHASQGGLNAKELKQFSQRYYPKYKDKAGVISKNDFAKGVRPKVITPSGQMQTIGQEPLKPNQNPSRQPVEPKKSTKIDPSAYGGKLGFGK